MSGHRARGFKCRAQAFDSNRAMRTQELKLRVQRSDYIVDPVAVARAIIRHSISYRRWWNPRMVCAAPAALSLTSGGPSVRLPIQVSGTADSVAARSSRATHTSNS